MSNFSDISHAVEHLRSGRVVAFPTETVYGLGANARNSAAIDRVFALKGRPRNNPLIVHVSGPEMAQTVVRFWPRAAEKLATALWPGPLSILLPRRPELPDAVTAGSDLVAVRCPNHPLALALIFEFGGPIVGPSANLSGRISPTTAAHVRESFAESDVYVLDGGACHTGIESTVVDVTSSPVRILRPGFIGAEQIAEVIGAEVVQALTTSTADVPMISPGLLEKHYAPRTPALLFDRGAWPTVLGELRAAVISHSLGSAPEPHRLIVMPADSAGYAAALYRALREADTAKVEVILIERPPSGAIEGDPIWVAVTDRLRRATSG